GGARQQGLHHRGDSGGGFARCIAGGRPGGVRRGGRAQRMREVYAAEPGGRDGFSDVGNRGAGWCVYLESRRAGAHPVATREGRFRVPVVPTPADAVGGGKCRAAADAGGPGRWAGGGTRAAELGRDGFLRGADAVSALRRADAEGGDRARAGALARAAAGG